MPFRRLVASICARLGYPASSADMAELQNRLDGLVRPDIGLKLITRYSGWTAPNLLLALEQSRSQLFQDLFVLLELNFKSNGFFVEFGATDGVLLSNTHLLEKQFGWQGILAEPAITWHSELHKNRNCSIETSCVWKESGSQLLFQETVDAKLSTVKDYSSIDGHATARASGNSYSVPTITLKDLLRKHSAPKQMDYLSVDTEGSEFDILAAFDFHAYSFRIITVEHNHTSQRESIHQLLTANGYQRKFEDLSQFDDWYVLNDN